RSAASSRPTMPSTRSSGRWPPWPGSSRRRNDDLGGPGESRRHPKGGHMTRSLRTLGFILGIIVSATLAVSSPATAVEVGEPAPDFKLASTRGIDIALSEFRGKKWVFLEFYGGDFHPT